MAIQVLRVRVCDVCSEREGVCRYRISRQEAEPRSTTFDLCPTHAKPLEDLLTSKPDARRRKRKVVPVSQIQKTSGQAKGATKKAAPKRSGN